MKRKAQALVLLAALGGGCVTTQKADPTAQPHQGVAGTMSAVPGAVGPWGEPVPARTDGKGKKADGVTQANAKSNGKADGGIQQAVGWGAKTGAPPLPTPMPGAVAATGALVGGQGPAYGSGRTSVRFAAPAGMRVAWYTGAPGAGGFGPTMVEAPGRYNFPQGAAYRLKLSNFPNRDLELYPTLEIIPASSKTATFLAHSAVPITITEEDLEQVTAGNFVVKVIYLPDPAYQDLTAVGPDEIVSTRLEPGVDPVAEAQRRGSVLAILRIGNIDLEAPNTPPLSAPAGAPPGMPGMLPGRPLPPGAIPVNPGMPAGPNGVPFAPNGVPAGPGGVPVTPGGELVPPPGMRIPDAPRSGAKVNASVEAVAFRTK
jgi:hypothetical protein